ncbi:VOC family protein [Paenibacillus sp. MMO-58]|uniref:VOC family protein n=1 Tax=Paenibacillus sp. MMO-58 TaxID=3081290 RepID=UPI0030192AB7
MPVKPHPVKASIGSIFIHVRNMERAANWYAALLGIELIDPSFDSVFPLKVDNAFLILDANRADSFQPSELPLFSFPTDDIEETVAFLDDLQVELVGQPERFPDISFVTVKDSEGNRLMFVQEL